VTQHVHQARSGRRKRGKKRPRKGLDIGSAAALQTHRELEYLRNPSKERAAKLKEVKRGKL
jgi:hypothetical protein